MKNSVLIHLSGHTHAFTAEQDAFDALTHYLQRAKAGLAGNPDRDEVLADLEQSIGEKLSARLSRPDQAAKLEDIKAVLSEVGSVNGEEAQIPTQKRLPRWRRPLARIKERQTLLGVCTGLSAFGDISLDWVQLGMMIFIGATSGVGLVIYLVLGLMLPVVETRAEYEAMVRQAEQAAQ